MHPSAGKIGEQLLVHLRIGHGKFQHNIFGDLSAVMFVVLCQVGVHDFFAGGVFLEKERFLIKKPSAAIPQNGHTLGTHMFRHGDHVGFFQSRVHDLLGFSGFGHCGDPIPQHCRTFKVQCFCCTLHFLLHSLYGICAAHLDIRFRLLNHFCVIFLRNAAAANAHALLDVIVQAGACLFEILRKTFAARGQLKYTVCLFGSFPCHIATHIRSQIGAGFLLVFLYRQSGIRLLGKAEIGIPLVIFQQNVIFRLMLFDQAAFQNKGFIFRVGDNKIVVIHMLHHTCHFGGMVG